MQTYTVTCATNSSLIQTWETVWTRDMIAEHPDDILDTYEFPGVGETYGYSDGTRERVWKRYDDDLGTTVRMSIIASPKQS